MIYLVPPQGDMVRHARSRGYIVDENKNGMKKDLFGMTKQDGQRQHSLDFTHSPVLGFANGLPLAPV